MRRDAGFEKGLIEPAPPTNFDSAEDVMPEDLPEKVLENKPATSAGLPLPESPFGAKLYGCRVALENRQLGRAGRLFEGLSTFSGQADSHTRHRRSSAK